MLQDLQALGVEVPEQWGFDPKHHNLKWVREPTGQDVYRMGTRRRLFGESSILQVNDHCHVYPGCGSERGRVAGETWRNPTKLS